MIVFNIDKVLKPDAWFQSPKAENCENPAAGAFDTLDEPLGCSPMGCSLMTCQSFMIARMSLVN